MTSIDRFTQEFDELSNRAGKRFAMAAQALAPRMAPEQLEEWAEIALRIANSGWHAWESSIAYFEVSPALLDFAGGEELLDAGRYGIELCGYSFEPGVTYFRGLAQLLEDGAFESAGSIEETGRTIRSRFSHASGLLSDYLRTAFHIGLTNDIVEVKRWGEIAAEMSALERADLLAFLAASHDVDSMDWAFIRELNTVSVTASLDFMRAHPALARSLDDALCAELQRSVLAFAADADDIKPWLDSLRRAIPSLPRLQRGELIRLFTELPAIELAESLMEGLDRLPLHRPEVLRTWIARLHDYLPLNIEAARGYLSIESATSADLLESLLGQVNFSECRRTLQLYSEAMVGRRLAIETRDEQVENFRDLPATDGLSIYLPESISQYSDAEDNFSLYKISLLHQLGYYEFGTFEFAFGGSFVAFRDYFSTFPEPGLAAVIFQLLEDARIDWALERRYRGAAASLRRFKADALDSLPDAEGAPATFVYLDALLRFSLDGDIAFVDTGLLADMTELERQIGRLASEGADVYLTMEILGECYSLIARGRESKPPQPVESEPDSEPQEQVPPPVNFRGKLEPDRVRVNLQLAGLEEQDVEFSDEQEEMFSLSAMIDPKDVTIEQLKKGDVQEALGMMITDLEGRSADELSEEEREALEEFRGMLDMPRTQETDAYQYDEWDCVIEDYRRRWCTLYEIRNLDEQPEFVDRTLKELRAVAKSVRRQLNNLRPELLRKVKGVIDGEELDLEKAVELMVDKRAGLSPEERIYVERLRKDRDVSALFLLDMSASTDDRIPEPEATETREPPPWDKDDFLHDYYGAKSDPDRRKRIIDLEKEAVVLMAEALEVLGDSYSVCGFSGYGRDQVDFYLCKDFEEPYNIRAKGRIGGMKPCRSTRMGPAIRHATKRLVATESRIKAMIIISDGYPQDFDYGKDRNSRDYGIKDTTKALAEARQQGVQAFCLTVDPSGHDYLREMCPDQQYMVIQDISQLPDELSKVYRSLTA